MGIAVTLVIGSVLTSTSLYRVLNVDFGFDPRDVTIATVRPRETKYVGPRRAEYQERILDRLRNTYGVESVAAVSHMPMDRRLPARAAVATGESPDQRADSRMRLLSPGALRSLGVPMPEGREFTRDDRDGGVPVAIVNERLARTLWPATTPIGRWLAVGTGRQQTQYQVIGVAGNVRGVLWRPPDPELYLSHLQHNAREMIVAVRSGRRAEALDAIRQAALAEDPMQAISGAAAIDDLVGASTSHLRFGTAVLAVFGIFAVALAASGILAVVVYSVARRTREFSIRMALGARPRQIVRLVLGDVTLALCAGLASGMLAAYYLSALLVSRGLLVRAPRFDGTTYGTSAVLITAIVLLAAWWPAHRAARQNPAECLSAE